jgi:hypothetical protein
MSEENVALVLAPSRSLQRSLPLHQSVEQLLDVTAVEVVGDSRLHLSFEDPTVGDVDSQRGSGVACWSRFPIPPTSHASASIPKRARSPGPTGLIWLRSRCTRRLAATSSSRHRAGDEPRATTPAGSARRYIRRGRLWASVSRRSSMFAGSLWPPSRTFDCHAEGRGFESHQPLQEDPRFAGLFVRAVGWIFCVGPVSIRIQRPRRCSPRINVLHLQAVRG